ncbi:MAG: hypothetical protein XD92_1502 [Proteiniphilum acetatigenes]|uniref:Lipoprotein n=1 Tax=Proteiniphilum acetatigenes TaxID=294710 RepID=A0A101HF97_9BACT|nr:MAG: hypothetical protein XD92_1502 [Proteiniphilum acetatigenes]
MNRTRFFPQLLVLSVTLLLFAHCAGNRRPMNVDELMMNAEALAGETVIVEGLCTHVCTKSGMKLFLQGTDKTQTLRAESDATLGKFDPASVEKNVRVRGKLVEEQISDNSPVSHGEEGEGCETEQAAEKIYYIAATSYQIID